MTLNLEDWVRDVPDYPEPGIIFKDLTPILAHPPAFQQAIEWYADQVTSIEPDVIAAVDARGFLFAAPVAYRMKLPLVLLRKLGKLPPEVITIDYKLEYGQSTQMELQTHGIESGQKVAIVDDLLATGGTAAAAARLVEQLGGEVTAQIFLIELAFLPGRDRIDEQTPGCPVMSNIVYR